MTFEMKMQEERNAAYDAGREEGIAAGAEQTARNMLARGYDAAEIAEVTGLSPERVRQLAAETGSC